MIQSRARLVRIVRPLLIAGVLLLVLPVLFEKRLIYHPIRDHEVTARELGLDHENVTLVAEDGVRLDAVFLPAKDSRVTVLFTHGNAGNLSHRLDRTIFLQARLGADVLLFDYRGYGRSEGSPDEDGTYRDARAAYRWLTEERKVAADRLVLFGESLGSAIALDLAVSRPCRALVLEAPFTSVPDMARVVFPFLPRSFVRTQYDNLDKVRRLRVPLLVLHGERDEIVPFAQGRRLFEAAPEPKRFFPIPGAGHNDTYIVGGDATGLRSRSPGRLVAAIRRPENSQGASRSSQVLAHSRAANSSSPTSRTKARRSDSRGPRHCMSSSVSASGASVAASPAACRARRRCGGRGGIPRGRPRRAPTVPRAASSGMSSIRRYRPRRRRRTWLQRGTPGCRPRVAHEGQ